MSNPGKTNEKPDGKPQGQSGEMNTLWGGAAKKAGTSEAAAAGAATAAEHPRAAWFRASKYAMFIHWGLYAQAGNVWKGKNHHGIAEWLMRRARIPVGEYESLAKDFNPQGFNAEEWVLLAKAAGMRYMVLTSKHHEGFAMFKSLASPYNIVDATPFKRDPIAELAAACRKHGMGLGFYYSQFLDWHEKDASGNDWDFGPNDSPERNFDHYLHAKALPQITELLTNYGEVALIWFDTPGTISRSACEALQAHIRKLQPKCLINSRIGNGLGDYSSLGDQEIPLVVPETLWETVDTHNDTWAYSKHDHHWKSPAELISRLCRVASLGGTYMLNVGPTGEGRIPEASAEILRRVGSWLDRNGAAIYGCGRSPIGEQAWGVATVSGSTLYLHVLKWPRSGKLVVPGIGAAGAEGRVLATGSVLATGKPVKVEQATAGLLVHVPQDAPELPITVIAISGGTSGFAEKAKAVKSGGSGTGIGNAQSHYFHPGLANLFRAPFAELSNARHCKKQWMEKFGDWHHAEVIEGFADGSSARWDFTSLGRELCNVYLTYECLPDGDGSELEITIGGAGFAFPLQCTGTDFGKRSRFRNECLGVVEVPKAGPFTLELKGLDIKGTDAIRLEELRLEPVE